MKKKQILALVLGAAMTMSMLAGCGNSAEEAAPAAKEEAAEEAETETAKEAETEAAEEEAETEAVEEEAAAGEIPADYFAGEELTIAITKRELDKSESFNDKPFVAEIEAATGIKINWIEIDNSVADERVSTMLADPANMPDVLLGLLDTNDLSANPNLFANLLENDVLGTYGTHILDSYEAGGQGLTTLLTMPDGAIRSLAGNFGSDYGTDFGYMWWINKSWLDQVGLDVPTTTDEVYEALCAFRDNDMNGNGDTTDELPLAFNEGQHYGIQNLANAFGIGGQGSGYWQWWWDLREGTVNSVCDTQAYRDFLEYTHMLAAEGLIDVEGFSDTYEQFTAKIANDRVGMFFGWSPSNQQAADPSEWIAMGPVTAEGYEFAKTGFLNKSYANLGAFAVAASSDKVDVAVHWWDYMHSSKEIKALVRAGGLYINDKGQEAWGVPAEEIPEGVDGVSWGYTITIGDVCAPYITADERIYYYDEETVMGNRGYMYKTLEPYLRVGEGIEVIGQRFTDSAKAEEKAFIETDLYPMIQNFYSTAIMEGVTDDSWNKFLDDLESYGYYDWLNWYQGQANGEY